MNHNKILFIPGWLDEGELRGFENTYNVWTKGLSVKRELKEEVIIAHSAGALLALLNWEKNSKVKLILVGIPLPKRNLIGLFFRWVGFRLKEERKMPARKTKLKEYFPALRKLAQVIKFDPVEAIKAIPKEQVLIVRGVNDVYLCNQKAINHLKSESVRVMEIDEAGHNWDEKFSLTIDEYLAEISENESDS